MNLSKAQQELPKIPIVLDTGVISDLAKYILGGLLLLWLVR